MKRWNAGKFDQDTGRWMGNGVQLPYGFGYTRIEPVKAPGGFARYMAKYMTKGFEHRRPEDKGRRLIRCSQRVAKIKAPRVGVGVALWDAKLASFLALNDLPDVGSLREKVGCRWAWYFRDVIWGTPLNEYRDIEWNDIGGKRVTVFCTRVASRDGEEIPWEWNGPGTVSCANNGVVKHGWFRNWGYRFERRPIEDAGWESDGTRRYVPEGPHVSEWGAERNGLVVRPDLRRTQTPFSIGEIGPLLVQGSFGLTDKIRPRPTRDERRKEKRGAVLRSVVENPF
jgi:hypothetical protein